MKNKKILVGVTGGIAAYKICSLIGKLIKAGADVKVVMSPAGTKFVTPLTFQALTNHAVYVDMWEIINKEEVEHISLAKWADLFVLAPASANTLGKLANGLCDNLLTTVITALPAKTKILVAPAMNTEMYNNPTVQKNIKTLQGLAKYVFMDTRVGVLACRDKGAGKIADNEAIFAAIDKLLK